MAFSHVDVFDVQRMTARANVLVTGLEQSTAVLGIKFYVKTDVFEDRGTLSVYADDSKAAAFEQIAALINALFPEPKEL